MDRNQPGEKMKAVKEYGNMNVSIAPASTNSWYGSYLESIANFFSLLTFPPDSAVEVIVDKCLVTFKVTVLNALGAYSPTKFGISAGISLGVTAPSATAYTAAIEREELADALHTGTYDMFWGPYVSARPMTALSVNLGTGSIIPDTLSLAVTASTSIDVTEQARIVARRYLDPSNIDLDGFIILAVAFERLSATENFHTGLSIEMDYRIKARDVSRNKQLKAR